MEILQVSKFSILNVYIIIITFGYDISLYFDTLLTSNPYNVGFLCTMACTPEPHRVISELKDQLEVISKVYNTNPVNHNS